MITFYFFVFGVFVVAFHCFYLSFWLYYSISLYNCQVSICTRLRSNFVQIGTFAVRRFQHFPHSFQLFHIVKLYHNRVLQQFNNLFTILSTLFFITFFRCYVKKSSFSTFPQALLLRLQQVNIIYTRVHACARVHLCACVRVCTRNFL